MGSQTRKYKYGKCGGKSRGKKSSRGLYNMRGCSKRHLVKKSRKSRKSKKLIKPTTEHQPFVTYTGGGGGGGGDEGDGIIVDLSNAYPAKGPAADGYGFLPGNISRGGGCGCGGGGWKGGGRKGGRRGRNKKGGCCGVMGGGGGGGGESAFVGTEWTPNASSWPGVTGQATGTHYPLNTYQPNDISRQMIATGAQPPYVGGGKRRRKQNGGGLIDSITYAGSSVMNTLRGLPQSSPNPLPFEGQYPNLNKQTIVVS